MELVTYVTHTGDSKEDMACHVCHDNHVKYVCYATSKPKSAAAVFCNMSSQSWIMGYSILHKVQAAAANNLFRILCMHGIIFPLLSNTTT